MLKSIHSLRISAISSFFSKITLLHYGLFLTKLVGQKLELLSENEHCSRKEIDTPGLYAFLVLKLHNPHRSPKTLV